MQSESHVRAAVIYHSATGTVHTLALAAVEGAGKAGADVRLRRVPEPASQAAAEARPEEARYRRASADVPEASLDDLVWADVVLFGTPTRLGTMSAPLKAFIETTGPLWSAGGLADKVYSAFTSSGTGHGGQGGGMLALTDVFCHWGGIIVPPGCPGPVPPRPGDGPPGDAALEAARYQAWRAVTTAAALGARRARPL
ncbi:NAD(P)H-dependent oxidoreductase [Streptomyces sp. WMMC500]|uniref:flavodoxin family protein n=1 Tax=Streptomyces sp. WMMC500 TaxID=3015154 RepID=UPI00248AF38B|nr:NAD(P)H-dependent oxidoreductase [Streptomyces sp. WMMC500]WBB61573.1 NAD(P)H-dependent oxidoreductase [Streptomyces sp. WMMC500]